MKPMIRPVVLMLGCFALVAGVFAPVQASHNDDELENGIKGKVEAMVCVAKRSGKTKCKFDEVPARVTIQPASGGSTVVDADHSGKFRVGLEPGDYSLTATYNGTTSSPVSVHVEEDDYENVKLYIRGNVFIRL